MSKIITVTIEGVSRRMVEQTVSILASNYPMVSDLKIRKVRNKGAYRCKVEYIADAVLSVAETTSILDRIEDGLRAGESQSVSWFTGKPDSTITEAQQAFKQLTAIIREQN